MDIKNIFKKSKHIIKKSKYDIILDKYRNKIIRKSKDKILKGSYYKIIFTENHIIKEYFKNDLKKEIIFYGDISYIKKERILSCFSNDTDKSELKIRNSKSIFLDLTFYNTDNKIKKFLNHFRNYHNKCIEKLMNEHIKIKNRY